MQSNRRSTLFPVATAALTLLVVLAQRVPGATQDIAIDSDGFTLLVRQPIAAVIWAGHLAMLGLGGCLFMLWKRTRKRWWLAAASFVISSELTKIALDPPADAATTSAWVVAGISLGAMVALAAALIARARDGTVWLGRLAGASLAFGASVTALQLMRVPLAGVLHDVGLADLPMAVATAGLVAAALFAATVMSGAGSSGLDG